MDRKNAALYQQDPQFRHRAVLSGEAVPSNERCDEKEPENRQDNMWDGGPSTIEIITKGEFNTD